jgi:hypothetical protein
VNVQDPEVALAYVPEAVDRADGHSDPSPGRRADDVVAECEFGFAFKDVEGIDVVVVRVRLHGEAWTEPRIDGLELGEFCEHTMVTGTTLNLLAVNGTDSHLRHRVSISGACARLVGRTSAGP